MSESPRQNRPQLTLEEMQQLKWLLGGGLTVLSVWTVFFLEIEAWTWLALTTAGVATVLARPAWPARIPRWVHRLAFPFIVAFFAGDLWLTGEVLPAMVRLDILLLLYRGVTYRQRRDDLQVIVLGLFLVVVAGVLTVSLAFAVQIVAFTAGALGFLLAITLTAAMEGKNPNAKIQISSGVPAWARHVEWGRLMRRVRAVTDWRVVALGGGLFAGLVVLSALLFLAIPRFQLENSFFLERFISKKAKTGFSDTIRFGDVTDIQQDNGVALSVDVSDRARIPATPYWRMLVLDEYRDGTFRLSAALRRRGFSAELTRAAIRGSAEPATGEPVYWTFYLEAGVSRFMPLLGAFGELRFREAQKFRVAPELGVVALRDEPVTMTAYRVEGMEGGGAVKDAEFATLLRERGKNPRMAGAVMLRLGVSEADVAVLERIVGEIAGGARLPAAEFARRAGAWLAKRHAYSLQPKIPAGAGDPLVRWLDSNEGGHCELFAGSLVLLVRAAGIPARVATGFRGGTWNGYSNNFTLRNSDAHAWCEVFDAATGSWVRTDPTPGATSEENAGEAALARRTDRSWTARFDSLRVFWYRRIVSFDQRDQVETLKAMKEATEASGKRLREWLERAATAVKAWIATPWDGRRVAVTFGIVAAIAGAVWSAANFRVLILDFRFGKKARRGDAVRAEAGRWLRRLADERIASADRDGVVAELQRLRFGARETWGNAAGVFRRARRVWRAMKRGGIRTT